MRPPTVLFRLDRLKEDAGLESCGERKQLVTQLYPETESAIDQTEWVPGDEAGKCPVLVTSHTESGIFNERAKQDRHFHRRAIEIYLLIRGEMQIQVEDDLFNLNAGDMIVVNPGTWHEVRPTQSHFLCRSITTNCQVPSDKYTE